ncbi:MAG: NAD(P)/FAD-dependent oxidoreductase [Thermodesulfobacteriota bacterium]
MSTPYDLVVIGSGAAGAGAAMAARRAGRTVAVIDKSPLGGTCGLRGCIPKKVLAAAADAVMAARCLHRKGVKGKAGLDWKALVRAKRAFLRHKPERFEARLRSLGLAVFHGAAAFTGPDTLEVAGIPLAAGRVLVASGATPAPLDIPGEEHLATSDQFLDLDRLPRRVVFAGGGFIAFEFAHVAEAAGCQCTILHRGARVLKHFDPDLAELLAAAMRGRGIAIHAESPVCRLDRDGKRLTVTACPDNLVHYPADLAVHAAGRIPDIRDMNLQAADVEASIRGVHVNEFMQSVSNPRVYAAGDCAATPLAFTPAAVHEGEVAGHNILHGNQRAVDHSGMARVVYAWPRLAAVGLGEEEARAAGLDFAVHASDTTRDFAAAHRGLPCAGHKVLVENRTGRILGAHLLAAHAEETIAVFGLAIRLGLAARDLLRASFPYPSEAHGITGMLG